jgi:hypothetical protein
MPIRSAVDRLGVEQFPTELPVGGPEVGVERLLRDTHRLGRFARRAGAETNSIDETGSPEARSMTAPALPLRGEERAVAAFGARGEAVEGDPELEVPRQGRHLDAGVVDGELQFDHLVAHERILALDGVDGVRDVAGEFR